MGYPRAMALQARHWINSHCWRRCEVALSPRALLALFPRALLALLIRMVIGIALLEPRGTPHFDILIIRTSKVKSDARQLEWRKLCVSSGKANLRKLS